MRVRSLDVPLQSFPQAEVCTVFTLAPAPDSVEKAHIIDRAGLLKPLGSVFAFEQDAFLEHDD